MAIQSPPLTFTDSDNSSVIQYIDNPHLLTQLPNDPSTTALRLLSTNLETLFNCEVCSDGTISAASSISSSPRKIPIHKCILASRSPFFKELFGGGDTEKGKKDDYEMRELGKEVVVWYESLLVVLGYLYTGRVGSLPGGGICVCADTDCAHVACRPAIDFQIEALYTSSVFQISELVSLFQRHLLDVMDKVAEDDILMIFSVAHICGIGCEKLRSKCEEMVLNSMIDSVTIEKILPAEIANQIIHTRSVCKSQLLSLPEENSKIDIYSLPNKHIRRIHRALDSDDVELVRMLLKESPSTSLDDACALHYAVAHCDSKITNELLDLGLANVNHRNARGYSVLHVAAVRREPDFIASLLAKGALPSDVTSDGRKAIQISRRLTKILDYNRPMEEGMQAHNDRLCVEILENAETSHPILGEGALSLANAGDDIRSRLLYLETRVGMARLLFPKEAKIAMGLANVEGTMELALYNDNQDPAVDDLNDTPFKINQERLTRMSALSKTVEFAKRYFRRCAKVLDELMMDNDTIAFRGTETSEEKQQRKKRYQELQDVFSKAFFEDKRENDLSSISSSCSSSSSLGHRNSKIARR
ncbi:npr1 [Zostera marina]|uniref:Npr1 n=1 Tax=Zostera marina TaxID=29655 RepID=A0A0K9NNU6_ZOSMR|nr:npr1 [Zostera marina]